jgi:hypothetical protein
MRFTIRDVLWLMVVLEWRFRWVSDGGETIKH